MEKGSPSTVGHASAYHASGSPNPSGVGSPSIYDSSPINPEFFGTEQVSVVEKGVVYDLGLPVAPNTPISSNPAGVEAANDNASLIAHYSDLEHVTDDSTTVADGEAPPAYHQLTIEGGRGNVSAEVMQNGRISMLINSSARIPERVSSFEPASSRSSRGYAPNYVESEYPILNIVIQVVGSRGRGCPTFCGFGERTATCWPQIRLATHDVFASFVRQSGLDFFPIGGDPEQLMAYMVNNPGIIPKLATFRDGEITRKRKMIFEMLGGFWRSCIEPDPKTSKPFVAEAVIANPPSFAHMHCAQALGIPVHLMFTMPWTPTRAFSHPLANLQTSAITDKKTSNFMSYGLVELMTWQGIGDIINHWRKDSLSLEPIRAMMGAGLADYLHVPFTYCWSPSLVPKPKDWPSNIDVCGFFFRDPPHFTPPEELDQFLQVGPEPIYIGFGSIVMDNPQHMTEVIMSAVLEAGVRAVVSKGWSKLGTGMNDADVFFLDDCPHEWLFKHVSAVIHHGGAGTTACGLLNGRPTAIVPFFGDQPFWGDMVAAAGAGPRPIDHKNLDVASLVSAIRFCLAPTTLTAAQKLAQKMSGECGVKEAVKSFHRNLPMKNMSCDLLPRKAAVWRYELDTKHHLKLSDEAAFILMEQKKLKMKNIKPYRAKQIEIESKRWDPLSAGSSTLVDTVMDFTSDGKNMFVQPIKEIQKAKTLRRANSGEGPSGAAAASLAAGKGLGKMSSGLAKGIILDLPVAMADGFHALPVLYGDQPMPRGAVNDWKSGMAVGGKSLARGFFHGFTGLVADPVAGAIDDGAAGFAKGFVTGTLGVLFKPGAAMLGFVGYPMLGAYKSIRALHATPAESKILLARQIQGSDIGRTVSHDEEKIQLVLKGFETASR